MNFTSAREKATEIISQMTLEEKMSQLLCYSPAIPRLGINEYNWWNEAAHGVARAGIATVFPQVIGMAATFNPELINEVADAISTEARAKYNKSIEFGDRDIYKGLTFWAPNINIFRDPRWGRGQETFGEDPFLTATMGTSYIKGIQGNGEFLKAAACAKHFAVHSGPEKIRLQFNAEVSKKDLWETYLPAFEHAVKAGVAGVMGAYNRTNGKPCCANPELITKILREKWGFEGYLTSDDEAVDVIYEHHHYTNTMLDAAVISMNSGCNLCCGKAYKELPEAYKRGMVTEKEITEAVTIAYSIRVLLGEFEENRPFSDVPYSKLDCKEHRQLNLKTARESLVLLQNKNNFLPLNPGLKKKIAVVGPNAMSIKALEGNYNGHASQYITVADGIRSEFADSDIIVAEGSQIYTEEYNNCYGFKYQHSEGMAAASEADITILCLGLDCDMEGENVPHDSEFAVGGDRKVVTLPNTQIKLAEKVCDVCENVIVVTMQGSAVDVGEKVRNHAKAIIHAWYPGAMGGLAVAQLISGKFSPSGKLPLTFYYADTQLPDFMDYSLNNRTYRYFEGEPLYPFGFGLSYADVNYSDFRILQNNDEDITLTVTLTNNSNMSSTEKVQVYASFEDSRTTTPKYQLCNVKAVELAPQESKTVTLTIDKYWIKAVDENGTRITPDGKIILYAGGQQPDPRSEILTNKKCLSIPL